MWILSTDRAELHFFSGPSKIPGGYAILSHTWMGEEQSFQDIQTVGTRCAASGENPRDLVSAKIRNCCITARAYGHHWVWIDSCCIDKTSSTELSEAINSMFAWYVQAEICFAFLEDVPPNDDFAAPQSAFRRARWHTRGWTLQELLAPAYLLFMTNKWTPIGTRIALENLLEDVTGIHHVFLRHQRSFHTEASIAERMHWASRRTTTRIEDEAYCLFGLFDITMPILYGEGRRAFQRLQYELTRQSFDTSLLAWGEWYSPVLDALPARPAEDTQRVFSRTVTPSSAYALAPSPEAFGIPKVFYTPGVPKEHVMQPYLANQWPDHIDDTDKERKKTGPFGRVELPTFEIDPSGLKCRLPMAEVDGVTIAVLLCHIPGLHIGLLLHPAGETYGLRPRNLGIESYRAMWSFGSGSIFNICRITTLGSDLYNLTFRGKPLRATWRDIYISAAPVSHHTTDPAHRVLQFYPDRTQPVAFRIPRCTVGLMSALGLQPESTLEWDVTSSWAATSSWQVYVAFASLRLSERIDIVLGLCEESPSTDGNPIHWAWGQIRTPASGSSLVGWVTYVHDCACDHIDVWPGSAKEFGDEERKVRLSFEPCQYSPATTLVLRMVLEGRVYEAMLRNAGVVISADRELVDST